MCNSECNCNCNKNSQCNDKSILSTCDIKGSNSLCIKYDPCSDDTNAFCSTYYLTKPNADGVWSISECNSRLPANIDVGIIEQECSVLLVVNLANVDAYACDNTVCFKILLSYWYVNCNGCSIKLTKLVPITVTIKGNSN